MAAQEQAEQGQDAAQGAGGGRAGSGPEAGGGTQTSRTRTRTWTRGTRRIWPTWSSSRRTWSDLPDQVWYELRVRLLPHQEAENITWRSDTGDEDDHRGTNPGSPAKAGLFFSERCSLGQRRLRKQAALPPP